MRSKDKFWIATPYPVRAMNYEVTTNVSADDFPDLFNINLGLADVPGYILVYILIYACSAVVGTFGNAMIIVITLVCKKLRNSRNAFIVNLSVADLLVSTAIMPASIIGILYGKRWHDEHPTLCLLTAIICGPGCIVSLHTIAWIAISRYYYIIKFPLYNKYFTTQRVICYITLIWCLGFSVHMPNHFGWGKVRYSFMLRYCALDTDTFSYAMFYASILILGVIIAFVFYLKIYLVIRKSNLSKSLILGSKQKTYQTETKKEKNAMNDEIKILKATFRIFVLFVLAWLPASIILFLSLGDKIPPWVYLYAGMLSHINSTFNFIVYFFGNQIFLSAAKETFSPSLCKKKKSKDRSESLSKTVLMERKPQRLSFEDVSLL